MTDKKYFCIVCGTKQQLEFNYRHYKYYRCPKCKLVSTYPFPNKSTIIEHYKNRFKKGNYMLLQKFSDRYELIYKAYVGILKSELKKRGKSLKNSSILDIGCFTGDFLVLLLKKGANVYGLELQEEAIKIGRKKLGNKIIKADVMDKKVLPKKKFTVVSMLGLVEHVTNPVDLIKRCYGLLEPNGIILIQTPNSNSLFSHILRKFWPPYSPVEHIHLFSDKGIEKTLSEVGFTNLSIKPHWKRLPISYVYNMLDNFGPEFKFFLRPLLLLPKKILDLSLPFYVGEMIITATKPAKIRR